MADRVLPLVHLFFPCESASLDLADEKWLLKQPLHAVSILKEDEFPFQVEQLFVYAQLIYGVGSFNLSVQFVDQESGTELASTEPLQRLFNAANRGQMTEEVFELRDLTFPRAGVYEFRLKANHLTLRGGIVEFLVTGG